MPTDNEYMMCALCSKSVSLENSKTDEQGQPVHEECYINKLSRPSTEDPKPIT